MKGEAEMKNNYKHKLLVGGPLAVLENLERTGRVFFPLHGAHMGLAALLTWHGGKSPVSASFCDDLQKYYIKLTSISLY